MRTLILLLSLVTFSLVGCDTSSTNPGHHTPEETAAKQRENEQKRAAQPVAPPVQQASANLNGQELFTQNCAICHRDGANGAPPLAGIMGRREFPSGAPATDVSLRNTIKMGRANMPAFSGVLNDEQINALVTYVRTL